MSPIYYTNTNECKADFVKKCCVVYRRDVVRYANLQKFVLMSVILGHLDYTWQILANNVDNYLWNLYFT